MLALVPFEILGLAPRANALFSGLAQKLFFFSPACVCCVLQSPRKNDSFFYMRTRTYVYLATPVRRLRAPWLGS